MDARKSMNPKQVRAWGSVASLRKAERPGGSGDGERPLSYPSNYDRIQNELNYVFVDIPLSIRIGPVSLQMRGYLPRSATIWLSIASLKCRIIGKVTQGDGRGRISRLGGFNCIRGPVRPRGRPRHLMDRATASSASAIRRTSVCV